MFSLILAAGLLAQGQDYELLGRWNHTNSEGYIRFFPDGTFRLANAKGQLTAGKWQLLDGGAIELTVPASAKVNKVVEYKYRFKDDTFQMRIGGRWLVYKKSK